MAILLAVALCLAIGFLIAELGTAGISGSAAGLMRVAFTVGFGLGAISIVDFFCRVVQFSHPLAIESAIAMALLLVRVRRRRWSIQLSTTGDGVFQLPRWADHGLTAGFVIATCAAVYAVVVRCVVHPNGDGWDALAIWNLHARFLFRGGAVWHDGFTTLIPWSHPDYPLLLPASIAHFWTCLGREDARVSSLIGLSFFFATAVLLYSALALLRGRTAAKLGTLLLLSTPLFVQQGAAQYADVPLSFFFLAAIALQCVFAQAEQFAAKRGESGTSYRLLVLSGAAAGLAAWTKNEGLLFLVAMVLATGLIWRRRPTSGSQRMRPVPSWRPVLVLVLAMLPGLLWFVWFKHTINVPGDLFADRATALRKMAEIKRYGVIANWYGKELLGFGKWLGVPGTVLLTALSFLGDRNANGGKWTVQNRALRSTALTLGLTLAGYFAIYVITPNDLYWHLRFSLNRLFLQVWPSAILLALLVLRVSVSLDFEDNYSR